MIVVAIEETWTIRREGEGRIGWRSRCFRRHQPGRRQCQAASSRYANRFAGVSGWLSAGLVALPAGRSIGNLIMVPPRNLDWLESLNGFFID